MLLAVLWKIFFLKLPNKNRINKIEFVQKLWNTRSPLNLRKTSKTCRFPTSIRPWKILLSSSRRYIIQKHDLRARFPSGENISYDSSRRIENIKIRVNTLKRVLGQRNYFCWRGPWSSCPLDSNDPVCFLVSRPRAQLILKNSTYLLR